MKPVHPKGNQPRIFIGRTDAETETPVLWPPDVKSRFIRKDLDDGQDWRQEEKGTTEDEMFGWYSWLSGHEFEQALGDGDGQGSLVCCSPWDCKESDTTERLNNSKVTVRYGWGDRDRWMGERQTLVSIKPSLMEIWEMLWYWNIESYGDKNETDPCTRSVKAAGMKVNQGKGSGGVPGRWNSMCEASETSGLEMVSKGGFTNPTDESVWQSSF